MATAKSQMNAVSTGSLQASLLLWPKPRKGTGAQGVAASARLTKSLAGRVCCEAGDNEGPLADVRKWAATRRMFSPRTTSSETKRPTSSRRNLWWAPNRRPGPRTRALRWRGGLRPEASPSRACLHSTEQHLRPSTSSPWWGSCG